MNIAIYICLGCMLVFGFFSVLSRHLINAAIALAAVSAACGVLMYVLGAHTAAIFEISVCSGLVTVIFISAVSLSNGDKQASAPEKRAHLLPIILIAIGHSDMRREKRLRPRPLPRRRTRRAAR